MILIQRLPGLIIIDEIGLYTEAQLVVAIGLLPMFDGAADDVGPQEGRLASMPLNEYSVAMPGKTGKMPRKIPQLLLSHLLGIGRDEAMRTGQVTAFKQADVNQVVKIGFAHRAWILVHW